MPSLWAETRNLDRYELVGVVDVVSHVELRTVRTANPIVDAVRTVRPVLPEEFEIIVDYKGMRRPATTRRDGRLDLAAYEWQLQNYAYLRERQSEGPPVAVGILLFLNELNPTLGDFSTWRRETKANLTDVPIPPDTNWKSPNDVPVSKKFERMIHVTAITSDSRKLALGAFDNVARNIEICRGKEASGMNLFEAWPGNPNDEATCAACDARTFCPSLKEKNPNRTQVPLLPLN